MQSKIWPWKCSTCSTSCEKLVRPCWSWGRESTSSQFSLPKLDRFSKPKKLSVSLCTIDLKPLDRVCPLVLTRRSSRGQASRMRPPSKITQSSFEAAPCLTCQPADRNRPKMCHKAIIRQLQAEIISQVPLKLTIQQLLNRRLYWQKMNWDMCRGLTGEFRTFRGSWRHRWEHLRHNRLRRMTSLLFREPALISNVYKYCSTKLELRIRIWLLWMPL